ncbi:Uncharacterized protein TCM_039685 [Theobroma cacao]|uniref:Reverse transcriptase zinc-binding domain-containing protein n=1 Tax=Theobroma cacao TaxID=3641 RepID=A0A061GYD2_THECC|nr:Uncharacterized protein TCM_039685 [Theobroma cacao]
MRAFSENPRPAENLSPNFAAARMPFRCSEDQSFRSTCLNAAKIKRQSVTRSRCSRRFVSLVASVPVMVNGTLSHHLQMCRGLHQGCPLSPYLFNLVIESLGAIISKASSFGLCRGIFMGRNGILRYFQLISGLKINVGKSNLFGIAIDDQTLANWAALITCNLSSLPSTYLACRFTSCPFFRIPVGIKDEDWLANVVKKAIGFIPSQGNKIKFWTDEWVNGSILVVSPNGSYDAYSLYKFTMGNLSRDQWFWKLVWSNLVPPQVELFCWLALKGRIAVKTFKLAKLRVSQWAKAKWPATCSLIVDLIYDPSYISVAKGKPSAKSSCAWVRPPMNILKFNVDGAARCCLGPAGMGDVLRDSASFWASSRSLIIESDSMNAVRWCNNLETAPWRIRVGYYLPKAGVDKPFDLIQVF